MKLSWSHKLFLWINRHVGNWPIMDRLVYIVGYGGIVMLVFAVSIWVVYQGIVDIIIFAYITSIALGLGLLVSWFIGWIFPHRRPALELPTTKQLIHPWSNWKAFPSDHALISFIFISMAIYMGIGFLGAIFLIMLGLAIGGARVWAGVHYPRDILGGMILGIFISIISIYFFG
ncbi:MAG: phosphatase PAP2 family protein [Candidatus Magasanikbacteria bacterium]|jgi:undecaprenyl-diphosphatase|nr:phosphatase PAP2 family protein [Candidatus Magasanikbacteria bacterium]